MQPSQVTLAPQLDHGTPHDAAAERWTHQWDSEHALTFRQMGMAKMAICVRIHGSAHGHQGRGTRVHSFTTGASALWADPPIS